MIKCSCCGESCEVVRIDIGLGHTEYWGASSVHEEWVEVSDCCEEDTYEVDEYADDEDDEADELRTERGAGE